MFNTENHVLEDRNVRAVPPEHIRAAIWQAAVHGQSATTIWVWIAPLTAGATLPAASWNGRRGAEAVGVVNCDMNRAAKELTALQQARPEVLLLHGTSSLVWDGSPHRLPEQALHGSRFQRPEDGLHHRAAARGRT